MIENVIYLTKLGNNIVKLTKIGPPKKQLNFTKLFEKMSGKIENFEKILNYSLNLMVEKIVKIV